MSITTVNSVATLTTALTNATAGDTIKLAAGTYSGLTLKNLNFATDVKITSADLKHEAVLTDFSLTNVHGLGIINVDMNATSTLNNFAFKVTNSSAIHFDTVSVHGTMDANAQNDANGISIMGSSDISIKNSEFQQLGRAAAFTTSSNISLLNNEVHNIRSDGFDFAQVSVVKIMGNTFHDFTPVTGDHPDAIQFWTSGTTVASSHIAISQNVMMKGDGDTFQGIFMGASPDLLYQHVTIDDNLMVGIASNGIRVGGVSGLVLTDNEIVSFTGASKSTILIQNGDHVVASGNQAAAIGFDSVTHLTETADLKTALVSDLGQSVISLWQQSHDWLF